MLEKLKFEDNFLDVYNKEPRKVVVYGAGKSFKDFYEQIPAIDYICDRNAKSLKEVYGKRYMNRKS